MAGGKGPASLRYGVILTSVRAYVGALQFDNHFPACAQLHFMLSLLPPKYKIEVPDLPEAIYVAPGTIGPDGREELRRWIIKTQKEVGQAFSKFIEEEYKNIDFADN